MDPFPTPTNPAVDGVDEFDVDKFAAEGAVMSALTGLVVPLHNLDRAVAFAAAEGVDAATVLAEGMEDLAPHLRLPDSVRPVMDAMVALIAVADDSRRPKEAE